MKASKTKNFQKNQIKEQKNYLNTRFELIKEISNEEMNKECFDCRKKDPKYISINNSIFLCEDCAMIHKGFPDNISFIIDNNLNLLSNNYLKYLYYGGNSNLDTFINYDYPGLQNYTPEILYKTQAMIYYREKLKCKIEGKPKPISPNDIMAYKLVSENGLINIREGNKFKTKKIIKSRISNKDIINNYYNNYNNTYNTYNNFNYNYQSDINNKNNIIINKNQKIKIDKTNKNNINNCLNYCSLVDKSFFNEMKNLFSKKSYKNHFNNNANIMSYKNISKTKNKFNNYALTNRVDKSFDQSMTYRSNESNNYSITNREINNEPISTNRKLNKTAFSDEGFRSPDKNDYSHSPRYIKPMIKITQLKKNGFNKFCTEKEKLKKKKLTIDFAKITRYNNDSINSLKNKDKIYKQNKKIFKFFKISKNKDNINDDNNLSFEINDKKKELLNKMNQNMKLYLFNNYFNNKNNQEAKNVENRTEIGYNNNYNNNTFDINDDLNINNYQKKAIFNKYIKKNKNLNKSYFTEKEERKPIKVNLTLNYNNNLLKRKEDQKIKKKALKDKKEQEELENEAIHNLLFEKKDNDLFNNIIYLNNNDD